jgi:hypothetical protein
MRFVERPRRPGTEIPSGAAREEQPEKAPADQGEHEGATEQQIGDRTGPGAGYDIPNVPDQKTPGARPRATASRKSATPRSTTASSTRRTRR